MFNTNVTNSGPEGSLGWLPGLLSAAEFVTNAIVHKNDREDTQSFNREEAQKSREWQAQQAAMGRDWLADEAQKGRDFSARSYQTKVEDMRKAGLNPLMLYAQSGAPLPATSASGSSHPSGATASSSRGSTPKLAGLAAYTSSLAASRLKKDIENIDQDIKIKKQQEAIARENAKQAAIETDLKKYSVESQKSIYDFKLKQSQIDRYLYEAKQYLEAYRSNDGGKGIPAQIIRLIENGASAAVIAGAIAQGKNKDLVPKQVPAKEARENRKKNFESLYDTLP